MASNKTAAARDEGQSFPVPRYSANTSRHQQDGSGHGATSPKARPQDDNSDNEATDSSGSDSEEETIIDDEIQDDSFSLVVDADPKHDISVPEKVRVSSQDDEPTATSVPHTLLGEIRKMIQAEFGMLKASRKPNETKTDVQVTRDEVLESLPSQRASLHIDTQTRPSPIARSPTQQNARLSPDSPRAQLERSYSVGATPTSPERQTLVRFAEEEKWAAANRANKPASPTKSVPQLSPIDEKWGELFDGRGQATKRLEQVLKGLANYIIDEFMPHKSIVIPPDKMAALYTHHRVDNEAHPLTAIFHCRTKGWSVGLEDIYQDLGCEYYLIPKDAHSRPSVPALTPAGFTKWMTSCILAYPDAEAKRLDHIVSELPVNADGPWDGISERLPKQISRHLFPDKPERRTRRILDDVLRDFVDEFLPPSPKQQPPTRQQLPRIEIVPEKNRLSSSSGSTSSPRTAKYMPEVHSTRANSTTSSHPPPPTRLGRAYSDDPSRLSLIHNTSNRKRDSEPTPAPNSSGGRRRSSPSRTESYNRRSVGDIARGASSPIPGSPMEREGDEYQGYVPARIDYAPKGAAVERATPRRVATVVQPGVTGGPGPTWDEYLTGRQSVSGRGGVFGRGHKASV